MNTTEGNQMSKKNHRTSAKMIGTLSAALLAIALTPAAAHAAPDLLAASATPVTVNCSSGTVASAGSTSLRHNLWNRHSYTRLHQDQQRSDLGTHLVVGSAARVGDR